MARKLRDRRLIVVLAVALIYHIEAAVTIEAATHLYRVSDSPFQVDIASSVNSSLAQAEDQAADLAASWNLTSPFAFAQLAGTNDFCHPGPPCCAAVQTVVSLCGVKLVLKLISHDMQSHPQALWNFLDPSMLTRQ